MAERRRGALSGSGRQSPKARSAASSTRAHKSNGHIARMSDLPVEDLLRIMRGKKIGGHWPTLRERMKAAKLALPHCHPRMRPILAPEPGHDLSMLTDEALDQLERLVSKIERSGGDQARCRAAAEPADRANAERHAAARDENPLPIDRSGRRPRSGSNIDERTARHERLKRGRRSQGDYNG